VKIKLDQICRENVQVLYGTEYILIDDFFDLDFFEESHNYFLNNYTIINKLEHHYALSYHPLMSELKEYEAEMINAINSIWGVDCVENKASVTLTLARNMLPVHNDAHCENIPVRGVLYLSDVCGTTIHSDAMGSDPIEIGGKINQLLLFKVSENSYHSVGTTHQVDVDRMAMVMMFDRIRG